MQIFIPEGADVTSNELLEGREVLGRWRDTDAGQIVLHLLVPAEETESIMDRFEQQFVSTKGFHVILFPVDAVLPRPKPEPKPEQGKETVPPEPEEVKYGKQRINREELYAQVTEGLDTSLVFVGMGILSAVVAAVGLLRNDVAVIIGAMVIAPLLLPNVAMSLATTLADFILMRRAVVTNIVGIGVAFICAVAVGLLFTVDATVPSIASRTKLGPADIILAMAAGAAGALAFTQGLPGAVIGVMVAVALMPPLVVCGMLVGEGDFSSASGALLLTTANLICINLAGVSTFLAQGVRPRSWWEAKQAKKATWRAILVWIVLLAILGVILRLTQ